MSVDQFLSLVSNGGGWLAIFYIFVQHVLPKIAPAYAKSLDKQQNREDRLFAILNDTNHQNAKLTAALEDLVEAFKENNHRLERLEDSYLEGRFNRDQQ